MPSFVLLALTDNRKMSEYFRWLYAGASHVSKDLNTCVKTLNTKKRTGHTLQTLALTIYRKDGNRIDDNFINAVCQYYLCIMCTNVN